MGKFFLNIMASMNQWERDTISERTRDALHLKIVKNERAGQIPYGWTLAADKKTLLENEGEQKAVSLMKELHREGCSLRSICQELETKGHKPVGHKWHPKTIASILSRIA